MCIVGVKLSRVVSRRAGRSRGIAPRGETTPEGVWHQQYTHNHVWSRLYHDATIFFTATNVMIIKSNLNFESRPTAVPVAMSPRYLGGKYRSRLHPRSRKCAWQFLRETERVKSNCARPASSTSRGDNGVDQAVCLKAEFQMHTAVANGNGKFYTTMVYPCFSRSVCFSMGSPAWWRFGLCSSGSSLVSRWHDAPLVREIQIWRRRCKQIDLRSFGRRLMRFWWMWSSI